MSNKEWGVTLLVLAGILLVASLTAVIIYSAQGVGPEEIGWWPLWTSLISGAAASGVAVGLDWGQNPNGG